MNTFENEITYLEVQVLPCRKGRVINEAVNQENTAKLRRMESQAIKLGCQCTQTAVGDVTVGGKFPRKLLCMSPKSRVCQLKILGMRIQKKKWGGGGVAE